VGVDMRNLDRRHEHPVVDRVAPAEEQFAVMLDCEPRAWAVKETLRFQESADFAQLPCGKFFRVQPGESLSRKCAMPCTNASRVKVEDPLHLCRRGWATGRAGPAGFAVR
jgi:hypothetical protein